MLLKLDGRSRKVSTAAFSAPLLPEMMIPLWALIFCTFFFSPCRHLFSYITKDKQTESLVEKLCQRFRTARWVVILIFLPSASASQDFSEEMSLYVVLVKASHYILHVAK